MLIYPRNSTQHTSLSSPGPYLGYAEPFCDTKRNSQEPEAEQWICRVRLTPRGLNYSSWPKGIGLLQAPGAAASPKRLKGRTTFCLSHFPASPAKTQYRMSLSKQRHISFCAKKPKLLWVYCCILPPFTTNNMSDGFQCSRNSPSHRKACDLMSHSVDCVPELYTTLCFQGF